MKKQTFTLVELLVVIAIIGVLAGALFPAISSALESANRTACGSNCSGIAKMLLAKDMDNIITGTSPDASPIYNEKKEGYEGADQSERAGKLLFYERSAQGKSFMCPSCPAEGANRKKDPQGKIWNHISFTKGSREEREFDWSRGKSFREAEDYAIRNGIPKSDLACYVVADGYRSELKANSNGGHNHFEAGMCADKSAAVETIKDNPKWYEKNFGKYPTADPNSEEKLNALADRDIGILLY